MKKTIIFLLITIQWYNITEGTCSALKDKIHTLNEILESKILSQNNYIIVLSELMCFEAHLEECEQKEKNIVQGRLSSKKRSISF